MVGERRPPKMIAEIGTPSGDSQSSSIAGHWAAGDVNLPFGWAAGSPFFLPISGVQGRPFQSRHWAGGSSVMPSHQTPRSGVRATLVKMVLLRSVAIAF